MLSRKYIGAYLALFVACAPASGSAQAVAMRATFHDAKGQLRRALDTDGTLLTYAYDAVGNLGLLSRSQIDPNFHILGFTPDAAAVGALVTLQGRGFGAETIVRFAGMTASVVAVTSDGTSLSARVPSDATTGSISITTGSATAVSDDAFRVLVPPSIDAVTPRFAPAGARFSLTLSGSALQGSTLSLLPVPGNQATELSLLAGGTDSAAVRGFVAAPGTYVVMASNAAGASPANASAANTLVVYDPAKDADEDGVPDALDSCLQQPNPLKHDADGDGIGDACDANGTPAATTWLRWNAVPANRAATGSIVLGTETISVSYEGEVFRAQAGTGTLYWTATALKGPAIANGPTTPDIVGLFGGGTTHRVTFSPPVRDPLFAIYSLGQPGTPRTYVFDTSFEVLSGANSVNSMLTTQDGKTLLGREGLGIIRFKGLVSEINWTVPLSENWHGFTAGVMNP